MSVCASPNAVIARDPLDEWEANHAFAAFDAKYGIAPEAAQLLAGLPEAARLLVEQRFREMAASFARAIEAQRAFCRAEAERERSQAFLADLQRLDAYAFDTARAEGVPYNVVRDAIEDLTHHLADTEHRLPREDELKALISRRATFHRSRPNSAASIDGRTIGWERFH